MNFGVTPVAYSIPFDNSTNGFFAEDVQRAIEEIVRHALSGFSKRYVDTFIIIRATDEMILSDFVDIEPTGMLEIDGLLTILNV